MANLETDLKKFRKPGLFEKGCILQTTHRLLLEQAEIAVEENMDQRRKRYDYVHRYAECSLLALLQLKQHNQAYRSLAWLWAMPVQVGEV